jgi:hypothetical protein
MFLTSCKTNAPEPKPTLTELEFMELIYDIEALEASKVYRLETDEEYEARKARQGR